MAAVVNDRELVGWLILYVGEHNSIPAVVRDALLLARRAHEQDEWKLEQWLRAQPDG